MLASRPDRSGGPLAGSLHHVRPFPHTVRFQLSLFCGCRNAVVLPDKLRRPNSMPISISRATSADLESLLPMIRHMRQDDPWSEPFQESTVRASLDELLRNPLYGVVYIVRG